MRTTIDLADEPYRALKARAALHGTWSAATSNKDSSSPARASRRP